MEAQDVIDKGVRQTRCYIEAATRNVGFDKTDRRVRDGWIHPSFRWGGYKGSDSNHRDSVLTRLGVCTLPPS